MKLVELAEKLSCTLEGDGNIEIKGVATLEEATQEQLSFLTNVKYQKEAKETKAAAIIVSKESPSYDKAVLRHHNPYLTFAKALRLFFPTKQQSPTIHPTALLSESARIGKDVYIGAHTYVGENVILGDQVIIESNCTIHNSVSVGNNSFLHSGCVIRRGTIIGSNCILQSNCVIGADGFGFAKDDDGTWYKIIQTGVVILEDDVEIGANSTIDRATIGETRICKGVKIDNLVQVGHGSVIRQDSLICAQVGLAGSSKIGSNVILAGQVGVAGHLSIGDNVVATPKTGIPSSVAPDSIISGSPAMDHRLWMKSSSIMTRLPEIIKTLRNIEKRIETLEKASQVQP
jgi:UDP-3-O-[3-hydroxymyristoyl] glucosamine N-acyltransferase